MPESDYQAGDDATPERAESSTARQPRSAKAPTTQVDKGKGRAADAITVDDRLTAVQIDASTAQAEAGRPTDQSSVDPGPLPAVVAATLAPAPPRRKGRQQPQHERSTASPAPLVRPTPLPAPLPAQPQQPPAGITPAIHTPPAANRRPAPATPSHVTTRATPLPTTAAPPPIADDGLAAHASRMSLGPVSPPRATSSAPTPAWATPDESAVEAPMDISRPSTPHHAGSSTTAPTAPNLFSHNSFASQLSPCNHIFICPYPTDQVTNTQPQCSAVSSSQPRHPVPLTGPAHPSSSRPSDGPLSSCEHFTF